MVAHAHPVLLRGAGIAGPSPRPVLVKRLDQEFLPALLDEMLTPEGRAKVARSVMPRAAGPAPLRLYQPVHRTFHLVLMEVVCDRFGEPRLDPASIESAGVVVRRRALPGGRAVHQAWMQKEREVRGWMDVPDGEDDLDPDPARRPALLRGGNPEITRRLRQPGRRLDGFAESVSTLFVADPEVCRAAGRTLLYGLVPVASAEKTEAPVELEPSEADLDQVFPDLFDPGRQLLRPDPAEGAVDPEIANEHSYLQAGGDLSFLVSLDAFVQGSDPASLNALLRGVTAYHSGEDLRSLSPSLWEQRVSQGRMQRSTLEAELRRASADFLGENLPRRTGHVVWSLTAQQRAALRAVVRAKSTEQLRKMAAGEDRYDPRGGTYELRAFVRVKDEEGCPPKLVWCPQPSERFTIVPWYETGDAPPVRVVLPDATDREALKKLKPNVAFITPSSLAEKIGGVKLDDLMKGKGPGGGAGGAAFDWICGFNIPIITLVAFIVMFIFLALLNIVFWWLPFVKICFPLPRRD